MNDKTQKLDLIILGGGAAGLAAAVAYGRRIGGTSSFAVIEKEEKLGRKLLATGSGRCNLTNMNMSEEYYNASARPFMRTLLSRVTPQRLVASFEALGLICRADPEGRVYPCSNQASSVLDILTLWLEQTGCRVFCGCRAERIRKTDGGFVIEAGEKEFLAKTLILATGGKASKALGSDGSSYKFAQDLSLPCEPVFPSLAPVYVSDKQLPIIKGVRCAADVSLIADGKTVMKESGELQFNEKTVSGICVFQLSRGVNEFLTVKTVNGKPCREVTIEADLLPEYSREDISALLAKKCSELPNAPADALFAGVLNRKLGAYIMKKCGVEAKGKTLASVTEAQITALSKAVKQARFTPCAPSSFDSAQVTAGGIPLTETDRNMRSGRHQGLYIIGEALDADGMCGGYNLHFAFAGGITAGAHAAKTEVKNRDKNKRNKASS